MMAVAASNPSAKPGLASKPDRSIGFDMQAARQLFET
jgi:hypothetical protein